MARRHASGGKDSLDIEGVVSKAVAKVQKDHGITVAKAVSTNLLKFAKSRRTDIIGRSLSEHDLVGHAAARLVRDSSDPDGPCIRGIRSIHARNGVVDLKPFDGSGTVYLVLPAHVPTTALAGPCECWQQNGS